MQDIELLKGINPAKIISREIDKLNISQREFAKVVDMHSQTLNAIIKGRRKLTLEAALKIEKALNLPEAFLLVLQTYYEVKEYHNSLDINKTIVAPKIRDVVFWDTDISKINWTRQKKSVIKRVMERGNREEKLEIARFYNIPFENL